MSSSSSYTRKRGVIASRVKLEKAMAEVGLKTQAALAEQMQVQEGLDKPPRDLISKVFREKPVAPSTIERIASVLGVDAYSLYLNSHEQTVIREQPQQTHGDQIQDTEPAGRHKQSNKTRGFWPLAALIAIVVVFFGLHLYSDETPNAAEQGSKTEVDLSSVSIAVLPSTNDQVNVFVAALQDQLATRFRLPSNTAVQRYVSATENGISWQALDELAVDYVLYPEVQQLGRHTSFNMHRISQQQRVALMTVLPREAFDSKANITNFARAAEAEVVEFLRNGEVSNQILSSDALAAYLNAWDQLDQDNVELTVRRAHDEIQRVLREAPNHPEARATLCDILVRQSIVTGDKAVLNDAQMECDKTQTEDSAVVHFAKGQMTRKQGKTEVSIEHYKKAIALQSQFVDPYLGLIESLINRYQKTQDPTVFEEAETIYQQAYNIAPAFWKTPFSGSRLAYFRGNVEVAIQRITVSNNLQPTYNNTANLGSLNFCAGNIEAATENYVKLTEIAGSTALTDNYLGVLYFAAQDYEQAADYFKRSLDAMQADGSAGFMQAWINLGDAYRDSGRSTLATDAYEQAVLTGNALKVKGENSTNIELHIIYADLNLELLKNPSLTNEERQKYTQLLQAHGKKATDPEALTHTLLSWLQLGEIEEARPIYDKLAKICKGLVSQPNVVRMMGASTPVSQ